MPNRVCSLFAAVPMVLCAGSAESQSGRDPLTDRLCQLEERMKAQDEVIARQALELARLGSSESDAVLAEQRTAEIRALVEDVLADADARASLLADGLTAGYDKGFFVSSPDGKFSLKLNLEQQIRYIYNSSEQSGSMDDEVGGFQMRRTRLDFRGTAIDPALTYRLRLNADRSNGNAVLEYAYLAYDFGSEMNVKVGQFKPVFAREEFVSSTRQLAIERSYTADYYTVDYTQGIEAVHTGKWLRLHASLHDGSYAQNSEFNADRTDLAASARADVLISGDWKQFDDFSSWSGEKLAVLIGAGADYELGSEASTDLPDVFKYTADLSVELGGFNFFTALYGQQFNSEDFSSALDDATQIGFVAQAGFFVIPDKLELFGRYEWTDLDGFYYRNNGAGTQSGTGAIAEDELQFITAGGTYYFNRHNLKLSLDVVYSLDAVPAPNTGSGIVSSTDEDQFAVRSQLQWSF